MSQAERARTERLFIGVPTTADARAAIARTLPKNLPGKLVAPEKWHFTLRFLGPTTREARDAIIARLSDAKLGSRFNVRFGELGAFPNARSARILWLGVTRGGERMSELVDVAEDAARRAGFAPEARPFKPHLTLARIDPPRAISTLLGQKHHFDIEMAVQALILYRSQLGGGPARYDEVVKFDL